MEYVLRTHGIGKSYGRAKVLDNVSLNVPKGSIYGFIGRNGAGKTTLIRLICGMQDPSKGSYELYGINCKDKRIKRTRRRIGAVVETPSIYLNMTAEDNLKQQCLTLGLPSFDRINETLELVGLSGTGNKKAKNFSLGMKQRLGIAVSLIGNPDLLVLDEPINGLDPQGIIEIRELILKLNREYKITVFISSHILDELSKLATHYGFIDHGRIMKEISASELEASCRKCMRVEISDAKKLSIALDRMNIEYEILSSTSANIFGDVVLSELVKALSAENCNLLSAREHDETLETYFINLVGGGTND